MAPSRNIVIAGAGIGGLTTALALAQHGFRAVVLDQAKQLEGAGAGIQLSPNATRVLIGLGLEQRLLADAVVPSAVEVRTSRGNLLARIPLGDVAAARYGSPYWVTHRGDLQAALLDAARSNPDVAVKLDTKVEDYVVHGNGMTVACRRGTETADETCIGLIAADGLWSQLRIRLGHRERPVFGGRTAWRTLLPATAVAPDFRAVTVRLWLGHGAHLVHYPVKAGTLINVVAIVEDGWDTPGWSAPGTREDIVTHFDRGWTDEARELVALPERWQRWALFDLPPLRWWGDGPTTLVGDAAHPMLPFLAQGAAMAIEDAAVLAGSLARTPEDVTGAMRRYERERRKRTAQTQRAARRNGHAYHLAGTEAMLRNLYLRALGGKMLLKRYDWLYAWRPAPPKA